ncbi:MAG: hypothetical protein J2P23_07015 [Microlunatus sp.]|nr:hypothetical protein [Microlunatus sp.]
MALKKPSTRYAPGSWPDRPDERADPGPGRPCDQGPRRPHDAPAVVRLIKISTLADVGVPLSRLHELLVAGADEFAAAIDDIDRRLSAEILQRRRCRERTRKLAAGDSLGLPPDAVTYLNRLRELGLPERVIELERAAWILVAAEHPDQLPALMTIKTAQLDDPAVIKVYRDLSEGLDWQPDDPGWWPSPTTSSDCSRPERSRTEVFRALEYRRSWPDFSTQCSSPPRRTATGCSGSSSNALGRSDHDHADRNTGRRWCHDRPQRALMITARHDPTGRAPASRSRPVGS